ncbi:DUF6890 family protein [Gallibacterium anatis]|uniref:DUF6890 family protein n=1 Tax=Gallibacterium anatis TaxID=750 RepID=UPI000368F4B5|nr:hypothetical protein [Gallibacterium anatis]
MRSIEKNGYSQAIALRMHYLPQADNSEINLARAVWLNKQFFENLSDAVAVGISKCF